MLCFWYWQYLPNCSLASETLGFRKNLLQMKICQSIIDEGKFVIKNDPYFFSFPEMDLYSVKKSCVGWWNPSILENGKLVSGFWKGWNPWFQITSTFCLQLLLTRQVKTTKNRNCSTFFILTKKVEFMDSFHPSETNRGYNFKDLI